MKYLIQAIIIVLVSTTILAKITPTRAQLLPVAELILGNNYVR